MISRNISNGYSSLLLSITFPLTVIFSSAIFAENSWRDNEEEPIVVRLEELQTTQENELNPGKIKFIEISALRYVENLSMQYETYKAIG